MDAIREQLEKPLVAGIIGLVVGILFGLIVLGWWLLPVQWANASPAELSYDNQVEYLHMAMEAYSYNKDLALAKQRYDALGENASKALADILKNPAGLPPDTIQAFTLIAAETGAPLPTSAVAATPVPGGVVATPPPGATVLPTAVGGTTSATGGFLRSVLPICFGIVLLLGAAAIVIFLMRSRGGGTRAGPPTPAMQAQQAASQATYTDYSAAGTEPPVAQFMASYKLGDDLFDDSFSIDSPAGEFMGECGVGISETIGVGDPKKVTAFEVWLFDKNDIQTVTKVLMSAHAFADDATRQRLAAKGEPVRVEPGTETTLETQSLQLVARVVDMGYGDGALPPESFFDRFILELAVWPKA